MEPTQELSFGEKLAGTTFNPSNDSDVDKVKQAAAKFMDAMNDARQNSTVAAGAQMTYNSIWDAAIIASLEAQMLAVKAITWKY